ncbi:leucine-rich repeat domain-containing protein [Treponema sp. R80B11-R83G3]
MKNVFRVLSIAVIVAVIGFSMAACEDDGGNTLSSGNPAPQSVTYRGTADDGSIYTLKITENTARYVAQVGDTYVLNITKDGTTKTSSGTVKTAGSTLTLTPTGATATFTVTVNDSGITAISGTITLNDNTTQEAPTDITATPIPPEELPAVERWWSWADETATATVTHSVDADGVCTITIGGTAQSWGDVWKANTGYSYTAQANTTYEYKFEAWTQSGNRTLNVQYYGDHDDVVYLKKNINITAQRQTYTIKGESIPKGGTQSLEIGGANQLGTFYVKIISITPYTPPEELPDADRWWSWANETATATITHSVDADGVCTITIGGTAQSWGDVWKASAGYSYTAQANTTYEYKFEAWTQSGNRTLNVQYYGDHDDVVYLKKNINITAQRQTYTIKGESIPKGVTQVLEIGGANQLGTFYVKIISIAPYTPALEYYLITGEGNGTDNTYRVVSADGMSGAVTIPGTYNGKAVTEIGNSWEDWGNGAFSQTTITSITIPASVIRIGAHAFSACTTLSSVTFESGSKLQIIGGAAFNADSQLTSITIPASVEELHSCVFYSCPKLISVTFASGSNITFFDNDVFPEYNGRDTEGGNTLQTAYQNASTKSGTYTRPVNGSTWTKQ